MSVKSIVILSILISAGSSLRVISERDPIFNNRITLRCFDATVGQLSDALYFLNGTNLEEKINLVRVDRIVSFLITTRLEGNFTCSTSGDPRVQSDPVQLIFFPTTNVVLPTLPTVYAEIGSKATLNCALFPGRLVRYYFAVWSNGSQPGFVYDRTDSVPSPVSSPITPSRYSINPLTFALSIRNVTLSDTDLTYRCLVGVVSPSTQQTLHYEQTRSLNIRLVVYKRPNIIQNPEPQTISLRQSFLVRYTCVAVGDPAPIITWTHNGQPTTSPTRYNTVNTQPVADREGRGFVVNSTLGIFPLDETSTGSVRCMASVPAATLQDVEESIPSSSESARLSVLGGFKDVGVLITQGGDIIFKLTLPKVINVPVHVLMVYSNAHDSKDSQDDKNDQSNSVLQTNRTTAASFNNTDAITHIVFSSKLPFKIFRVGVALVSGSMEGPVQNNSRVHNVDSPSLVSTSLLKSQLIVASLVPTFFFVLVFIAIIVITMATHINKRKKRELEFHRSVLDRHADVLNILLDKLPEDPSGRVYLEMLSVVERILTVHLDEGSPHPGENDSRLSLDEVDLPEMSIKSSALIRTLGNVIEKGRRDPKLRPHLDRQMSTMILDQPDNMFHVLGRPQTPEDCGYEGSHSTSTKEELERDQEL